MLYCKNIANKNSESSSSEPPTQVEGNKGARSEPQKGRQFMLEELQQATKNFDEHNLIGKGSFGLVYKGLLCDGTVVAIKTRRGPQKQEFIEEVHYLSEIVHRNLVTLFGYCQEAGQQMLVFEYVPNGSISGHLYGLSHLHRLMPPVVHKGFKTNNVLVDENFISKVADAGVVMLLQRIEDAGPSQATDVSVFQDPEVGNFGLLSETSDVYSFGVFLLELVTGQEAARLSLNGSSKRLTQWVEASMGSDTLIDARMHGSYTSEGMRDLIRLTLRCLSLPGLQRPRMHYVVVELERILEMEMALTTVMGEGSAIVTLGSQLFTSA